VQGRAALGDIDGVAAEHGVDPRAQAALFRQPGEQSQRLVSDAILREVDVEPGGLDRQTLAALGVGREQLAEVELPHVAVMGSEGFPGRAGPEPLARRDLGWRGGHGSPFGGCARSHVA
jgi:hypothetical protein